MRNESFQPLNLRDSIAGEEDPGAALDVVRSMLQRRAVHARESAADARIHLSCSADGKSIDVGVTWPHHPSADVAKLLGMVVANHSKIADTALSLSGATGESSIELDVDEDTDGVFYISRRDC